MAVVTLELRPDFRVFSRAQRRVSDGAKRVRVEYDLVRGSLRRFNTTTKITNVEYRKLTQEIIRNSRSTKQARVSITRLNERLYRTGQVSKNLVPLFRRLRLSIDNLDRNSLARLNNRLSSTRLAMRALGGSIAAFSFIRIASSFEQLRIRLETFTRSSVVANREWERLITLSAKTQVNVDELIGSYITLRTVGINPTTKELANLADFAAATGLQFEQLTNLIFRGTSSTELFYNAGITARVEGEKLRITYQGVTQVIDRTNSAILEYIVALSKANGFTGAAETVAMGLTGALSNIIGNFKAFVEQAGISTGATGRLSKSISTVAEVFADLRKELVSNEGLALAFRIVITEIAFELAFLAGFMLLNFIPTIIRVGLTWATTFGGLYTIFFNVFLVKTLEGLGLFEDGFSVAFARASDIFDGFLIDIQTSALFDYVLGITASFNGLGDSISNASGVFGLQRWEIPSSWRELRQTIETFLGADFSGDSGSRPLNPEGDASSIRAITSGEGVDPVQTVQASLLGALSSGGAIVTGLNVLAGIIITTMVPALEGLLIAVVANTAALFDRIRALFQNPLERFGTRQANLRRNVEIDEGVLASDNISNRRNASTVRARGGSRQRFGSAEDRSIRARELLRERDDRRNTGLIATQRRASNRIRRGQAQSVLGQGGRELLQEQVNLNRTNLGRGARTLAEQSNGNIRGSFLGRPFAGVGAAAQQGSAGGGGFRGGAIAASNRIGQNVRAIPGQVGGLFRGGNPNAASRAPGRSRDIAGAFGRRNVGGGIPPAEAALFGTGGYKRFTSTLTRARKRTGSFFTNVRRGGRVGALGKISALALLIFGGAANAANPDNPEETILQSIGKINFSEITMKTKSLISEYGTDGLMYYFMFGAPGLGKLTGGIASLGTSLLGGFRAVAARIGLLLAPLGLSILSGPVGWAALGAVGVGALAYAYWDDLKPYFDTMWTDVTAFFAELDFGSLWNGLITSLAATLGRAGNEVKRYFGLGAELDPNTADTRLQNIDFTTLQTGGPVSGAGTGTSDSIPALLSNGEFVVNAMSAASNMGLLEALNENRFQGGGFVGPRLPSRERERAGNFAGVDPTNLTDALIRNLNVTQDFTNTMEILDDNVKEFVSNSEDAGTLDRLLAQIVRLQKDGQPASNQIRQYNNLLEDQIKAYAVANPAAEELADTVNTFGTVATTVAGHLQNAIQRLSATSGNQDLAGLGALVGQGRELFSAFGTADGETSSLFDRAGAGFDEAVQGFQSGGLVDGPGTGTSDSVPANLSTGEFVVNASATEGNEDSLNLLNSGQAAGDVIASSSGASENNEDPQGLIETLQLAIKLQGQLTMTTALQSAARASLMLGESAQYVAGQSSEKAAFEDTQVNNTAVMQREGMKQSAASKGIAIIGAIIAAALGILNVFADPTLPTVAKFPLAAAIGILGVAQIATIASAATGGLIQGPGSGTSDDIPLMVSNGEFVVNAAATRQNLGLLQALNGAPSGSLPSTGGTVVQGGTAQTGGLVGMSSGGSGGQVTVVNNTTINVSGNVDQRSIDQIRGVIMGSPTEVNRSNSRGERASQSIRRVR